MVRRKKTTIFLDAKESTTVLELKKMIEGITKKGPSEQQLYNKDDAGAGYFYIRAGGGLGSCFLILSFSRPNHRETLVHCGHSIVS